MSYPNTFYCRYRYRDHHFLNTLSSLLELMYGGSADQRDLVPLSTLHMMTCSHSLFLPTMLDSADDPSKYQAKGSIHKPLSVVPQLFIF